MSEQMPAILVLGSRGQVGWELCRTLAPLGAVTAVDFPEVDLASPDSLRQCIRGVAPKLIVNAAAYTAVDKAESEHGIARDINASAPGLMAAEAARLGALMVHYSTDYVFDGRKDGLYGEEDLPNPLSVYGRTKLEGELAVQSASAAHLIFRLCWVYGARGRNFMLTILRLAREREELRIVGDQYGAPTWSRAIAEATAFASGQVLRSGDPAGRNGIYHLCAAGSTSWHGFASAIVGRMPGAERKCREIRSITTPEYPLPAQRPSNSRFTCAKMRRVFGLELPAWEVGLSQALESVYP